VSGGGLFLVSLLVALENVFSGEPFRADGADKVLCDAVLGCATVSIPVWRCDGGEGEDRRSASVLPPPCDS
jgi:hypothetical protein